MTPDDRTSGGGLAARLGFQPRRFLRRAGIALSVVLLLLVAAIVLMARAYAHGFAYIGCVGPLEGLGSQGYPAEMVSFTSRQGYTLHGWFSPGARHPEIAIVVLPGAAGNSYFALSDAAMLAEAGYSTLVYEHRSCADPSLIHSGGYWESFDLQGAVDYLISRPDIQHVGVLGFSTGGSTALLAAPDQPGIEAVVAMGGFASLRYDILDPDLPHDPLDWAIRQMVMVFVADEMGVPISTISPIARIAEISPRPILLIYGEYEAEDGRMLEAAAEEPVELWIVPGVGHGGYREAYPDEFRARVLGFFSEAFGLDD